MKLLATVFLSIPPSLGQGFLPWAPFCNDTSDLILVTGLQDRPQPSKHLPPTTISPTSRLTFQRYLGIWTIHTAASVRRTSRPRNRRPVEGWRLAAATIAGETLSQSWDVWFSRNACEGLYGISPTLRGRNSWLSCARVPKSRCRPTIITSAERVGLLESQSSFLDSQPSQRDVSRKAFKLRQRWVLLQEILWFSSQPVCLRGRVRRSEHLCRLS